MCPTPVALDRPAKRVAAGTWLSTVLDVDGIVWQWGNTGGPLSIMPSPVGDTWTPRKLSLPTPIEDVADSGWHTLALATDGRLWSWGLNLYGEVGADNTSADDPYQVTGTYGAIAVGGFHSLAISTGGRLVSWGRNENGELGRGGSPNVSAPVELPEDIRIEAVAAGWRHSLALTTGGTLWGWGNSEFQKLGTQVTNAMMLPAPVLGLPQLKRIACGAEHSVLLDWEGKAWFLGRDAETGESAFARVEALSNVVAVAAGTWHSLALTTAGDVWVWGYDLPLVAGGGYADTLTLIPQAPIVQWRTNIVPITNVVMTQEIVLERREQIVTNAAPVYRYFRRHYLGVIDYQQNSTAPASRPPVSIPGALQGISHRGALLYTLNTIPSASIDQPQTLLSALAYDGVEAHLVDTVPLSVTNIITTANVVVHPVGTLIVTRDSWNSSFTNRVESWALDGDWKFRLQDSVPQSRHFYSMRMIDDILAVNTDRGIELVDLSQPDTLLSLAVSDDAACGSFNLDRLAGNREVGLWLPDAERGTYLIWSP
jgi:hypothetical protein